MQSLDSMPASWLRQLASILPTHLKARIRCCSSRLQSVVDQLGVGLTATGVGLGLNTPLDLAAQHITSLHTLQLQLNIGAACLQQQQQQGPEEQAPPEQQQLPPASYGQLYASDNLLQALTAGHIQQLPCGLPALRKLTVNLLQQPDLLAAVLSTRPPCLTHFKLFDRHQGVEFSAQELERRCTVLLQLSDCAPHLNTLEVDYRTYRLAHQYIHAALRQPLPCLHTLVLAPKLWHGHAEDCNPIIPHLTWASVFRPLLATLTRLEVGSRSLADTIAAEGAPAVSAGVGPPLAANMQAQALALPAAGGGGFRQQHSPAAPAEDEALHPTTSSSSGLGGLLRLKCSGIDGPSDDFWSLSWVGGFTSLTSLELSLCSTGELDCDVLAQLQQLQCLTLHYFEDEFVTSDQLAQLSACCKLTRLSMEALSVELPVGFGAGEDDIGDWPAAAAAGNGGGAGAGEAVGVASSSQPSLTAAAMGVAGPAAVQNAVMAIQQSMALPQLRWLTAGVMCKLSLCCFAPNLTRLKDLDYDLAMLDLPDGFITEQRAAGYEALAGLTDLQVLGVNISALVRHAAQPQSLVDLRELHVDMVGGMLSSCIDPGGLPCLPQLTKLVMTIDTKVHRNLKTTYTTAEDYLLWRNQSAVSHLRLRGSALLGGFLVKESLLHKLPTAMPELQLVEVVRAKDLTLQQLSRFVCARPCRRVLVQGCGAISDSDCVELEDAVGSDVAVEYSRQL